MSVADVTGIIAAIAALGALTPLVEAILKWRQNHRQPPPASGPGQQQQQQSHANLWVLFACVCGLATFAAASVIVVFGLTSTLTIGSASIQGLRIVLCVLSFLTVLAGSLGAARALRETSGDTAILGVTGCLAGYGVILAMIVI